jgi:hypothetical protein
MAVKSLSHSSILQPATTNSMLGDYESNYFHHLETVRLSSTASSVTFSNLAQYSDYQHLQFRVTGRSSRAADNDNLTIRFNSDSGTNYSFHRLYGQSSVVSNSGVNETKISIPGFGANSPAIFSSHVIDIVDAFESVKFPTLRALGGASAILVGLTSGSWRSTAGITSVTFDTDVAGDILSGSRFSLYGLKARS